jgi:hypothetical protein
MKKVLFLKKNRGHVLKLKCTDTTPNQINWKIAAF